MRSLFRTYLLPIYLFLLFVTPTTLAVSLSTGEAVDAFIEDNIHAHTFMVFAKSYCPHCRRTKSLLENEYASSKSKIINLDQLPENDGPMIQAHLQDSTGQRTVPNIFINGKQIGGNSEFQALHAQGRVNELLENGGKHEL